MVRRKLDAQEEKRYGKSGSNANTTYQRIEGELFKNEAELKTLLAKQKTLNEQLVPYQDQLDKINRIEVDLNQLKQEVEIDRQNYRLYLTEFDESRSSNDMNSEKIANASLLESAHAPAQTGQPQEAAQPDAGFFVGRVRRTGLGLFHGVPGQ